MPNHGAIEPLEYVTEVIAVPVVRRPLADTGNHYPAVKAVIDGLTDAGVIYDDGPDWISQITLKAPVLCPSDEREHLTVVVFGVARKEPGRWR